MLPEFKFHHIGIATNSIELTSEYYMEAGYSKSETTFDSIQNVNICFLSKPGMPMVELLEPVNDKSPVNKTIKTTGVSPYHCCYIVSDLDKALFDLRKKKFFMLSKPVKAIAINNNRICFLYNKEVGLIELVEIKNE